MSERAPEGPYVFQPYGPASHPERAPRFYAVAGLPGGAKIEDLTREQAELFLSFLATPETPTESEEPKVMSKYACSCVLSVPDYTGQRCSECGKRILPKRKSSPEPEGPSTEGKPTNEALAEWLELYVSEEIPPETQRWYRIAASRLRSPATRAEPENGKLTDRLTAILDRETPHGHDAHVEIVRLLCGAIYGMEAEYIGADGAARTRSAEDVRESNRWLRSMYRASADAEIEGWAKYRELRREIEALRATRAESPEVVGPLVSFRIEEGTGAVWREGRSYGWVFWLHGLGAGEYGVWPVGSIQGEPSEYVSGSSPFTGLTIRNREGEEVFGFCLRDDTAELRALPDGPWYRVDRESGEIRLLAAPQGEPDALRSAAQTLVDRLDEVHNDKAYVGVWAMAQLHGGPYRGPSYSDELDALDAALAAHSPDTSEEEGA